MGNAPRIRDYPVVAIFKVGMSDYDENVIYMPLAEAQDYFVTEEGVNQIEVMVENPDDIEALILPICAKPRATAWRSRPGRSATLTFFNALAVERNVMFLVLTMIILVAALNIISGLIMLVKDKGRDIAILRTMGATRGAIQRVFFITGAAIGTAGTIGGFIVGLLICLNVERIRQFISWISGVDPFNPELYYLAQLPAKMEAGPDPADRAAWRWPCRLRRHALSLMARGEARSRRGAEIRMSTPAPALELRNVARSYAEGKGRLDVFKDLNLTVYAGEIVALVGQSGSGKSSLLHIAGLLEAPTAGEVLIAGQNCSELDDMARTRIRRIGIGFVYQFHHLLPEFSAIENVDHATAHRRRDKALRPRRGREELLVRLGLGERLEHRPAELSGGEQQRVAIARAIANRPLLLLADEPTGNLDPATAARVHDELLRLIREEGLGALVATHNHDLAAGMSTHCPAGAGAHLRGMT